MRKKIKYEIAALNMPIDLKISKQVIIPAGKFEASNGARKGTSPWYLDKSSGLSVVESIHKRKTDIVVDYEHQTLNSAKNGQINKAAGWIVPQSIEYDEQLGILAEIRWTEAASEMIEKGEYRFLSPVFEYDNNGNVVRLINVALTNTPALDVLPEIKVSVNSDAEIINNNTNTSTDDANTETGDNMILDEIKKLLEIPPDASDQDVLDMIKDHVEKNRVKEQSEGEDPEKKDEPVAPASEPAQASASLDVIKLLQDQVAALTIESINNKKQSIISKAILDGKMMPQMEKWAYTLDVAALSSYVDAAPVIQALIGQQTAGNLAALSEKSASEPSEIQLKIYEGMGVDPKIAHRTGG